MKIDSPRSFWLRIDTLRGKESLKEIAQRCNLNYDTLRNKRSGKNPVYPNLVDGVVLAEALNTTAKFLLTGEDKEIGNFSPRIRAIIISCINAKEEDLCLVERVLRISSKNQTAI